jgi:PhzF family phenazine biosynthesis protein
MGLPLFVVDSFTDKPFGGNPAGVCFLETAQPEEWLQAVAAEINHTATAFVTLQSNSDGSDYDLRWFTATTELTLCGHGTLAAAYLLWETGRVARNQTIQFHTQKGGMLQASRNDENMMIDLPATPASPIPIPEGLIEALNGAKVLFTGQNKMDYFVELESEAAVRSLQPDLILMKKLPVRGVVVTAQASTTGLDFVSRFFAPSIGFNEDSVTGSSHTTLGPYWQKKLGKSSFVAYQASARGGKVPLTVEGERVFLGGQAVIIWRGELLV